VAAFIWLPDTCISVGSYILILKCIPWVLTKWGYFRWMRTLYSKSLRFSENSLNFSIAPLKTFSGLYWPKIIEFSLNLRDSLWFKFRAVHHGITWKVFIFFCVLRNTSFFFFWRSQQWYNSYEIGGQPIFLHLVLAMEVWSNSLSGVIKGSPSFTSKSRFLKNVSSLLAERHLSSVLFFYCLWIEGLKTYRFTNITVLPILHLPAQTCMKFSFYF